MNKERILIIGASGSIGSQVAKLVQAAGYEVRLTSSKKSDQKETVQLNLLTGEGLHQAFEGIDRAFFMSPVGYADQFKTVSPLIQEAKRRGLKKVVLMTAMGANADESSPFRRAEIELEKSGLNYNIVRPNWFMQNFSTFWVHNIKAENNITLPAGTAKTSFIHAQDIAEVIAQLLISETHNNKDFDLTGSESFTHTEAAQIISEAVGRKITYVDIEPERLKVELLQAGLPADYVEFMLAILGFLKLGYSERTTNAVPDILGKPARTFKQFATDSKELF